jgi:hypothetical protein
VIAQLQSDMTAAPQAFALIGPVERAAIDRALSELDHPASEALRELWIATGGGDMFETEELLSPLAEGLHALRERNLELRSAGLPADLLAFHVGLYITAVQPSGSLVALHPETLEVICAFDTLEEWYADLRREYAGTYGLPAPSA